MKNYYNVRDHKGRFFKIQKDLVPYYRSKEFIQRLESHLETERSGFVTLLAEIPYIFDIWEMASQEFKSKDNLFLQENYLVLNSRNDYELGFFLGRMSQLNPLPFNKIIFLPLSLPLSLGNTEPILQSRFRLFSFKAFNIIKIQSLDFNTVKLIEIKNKKNPLKDIVWKR